MCLLLVNPPAIPDEVKEALIKDYVERNRHYQQVWDIVNLYDTLLYQRMANPGSNADSGRERSDFYR